MGTKTLLTIKTDIALKEAAQETARELGLPLSTAINAFLRQLVRDKEMTFSSVFRATPGLERMIEKAREEYLRGETLGPFSSAEEAIAGLNSAIKNED